MKHHKIVGMCLTAMLLLSMAVAGTASAFRPALPAFEQCSKVQETREGTFEDSLCSKAKSPSEWTRTWVGGRQLGNGVWCQSSQETKGFYKDPDCQTFVSGGKQQWARVKHRRGIIAKSGIGKFRYANGGTFECSSDETEGAQFREASETKESVEEAAAKEIEVKKIKFKGCKSGGKECKTAGASTEEITTAELVGKLGYIKKATEVGLEQKPKSGTQFSEFECTILGVKSTVKVTGCVIAKIEPLNKMSKNEVKLKYGERVGEKSEQEPNKLEGGATCELTAENNITNTPEKTAITQEAELEMEDAIEIVA